jgi:hypothetical protein
VDVGIEKKSYDFVCPLFQSFKRINSAVGTADMEEKLHSNPNDQIPNSS